MSNNTVTTTTPTTNAIAAGAAAASAGPGAGPCPDGCLSTGAQLPPEPRLDLPAPQVGEAVATAALLADRTRAGIVRMLADGPHCVCELAAALGERQNNVSMHLARLREAGLVRAVRHSGDARWMFYERDDTRCAAALTTLTELLR
ncbi:MAG: metalloregulator ArsR/SmtB family transcription factor [Candidatus Limnocylindrales bacterium]|jgi:ArsR family transcriptional regulator